MRGTDEQQEWMFSYISAEKRVPKDHPLIHRYTTDLKGKELRSEFAYGVTSLPPQKSTTRKGSRSEPQSLVD